MLPPKTTFTYALLVGGYANHGHGTSNLVEILNSVLLIAREDTPYYMNDHILVWQATKVAERQKISKKMMTSGALYTPYATKFIGRQELMAREEQLRSRALGNDVYLVEHRKFYGGRWITTRHRVNLNAATCDCAAFGCNRMPCMHVIVVVDANEGRDSPEKKLAFREKWVAPYFHAEAYSKAYKGRTLTPPDLNEDPHVPGVTDAPDRVLPPPLPNPNVGRQRQKRMKSGKKRRTRAGWDADKYVKRTRSLWEASGPANPFVQATTVPFKLSRRGRPSRGRAAVAAVNPDVPQIGMDVGGREWSTDESVSNSSSAHEDVHSRDDEEVYSCDECAARDRVVGANFHPGAHVMCGRQELGLRGGRPDSHKERAIVMGVRKSGTSNYRSLLLHVRFPDGHCQTTLSKYVDRPNLI